ncbi:YciI family protein [Lysobacter koreensis]|uniref:YciI family protein n=1 Tax=Lysobacter koreensis TaxID=266122 RepID=A0ABW2YN75_9GAMM
MKRYLVLAWRNPGFDAAVVAPHRGFLDGLRAQGRLELTGAFSDQTGGAYVLLAANLDDARAIVDADPLHTAGASRLTVHEWNA